MWTMYRHTKGMLYLRVGTALHSESCEPLEVYRTLYDNDLSPLWARPKEMFYDEVAPDQRRFTECGRVRVVAPEDEATVLAFGYDAWGEGRPPEQFVADYAIDKNHVRGVRYLLEVPTGNPVANLNTLRFSQGLVGIASLSVDPKHRRKGYASALVRAVMELFRMENPGVRFVLFSEVNPTMYERLGFRRLPHEHQHHLPSVAMVTGDSPLDEHETRFLVDYF
jgi:GNAT superfamily N-acetyltransferase